MIPETILANVQSWVLQVVILGSIGAVLPMIFRIRHPRSQLVYCYVVLGACIVLPLVQPWQHPVVFLSNAPGVDVSVIGNTGAAAEV
jgi:hypothetical protein